MSEADRRTPDDQPPRPRRRSHAGARARPRPAGRSSGSGCGRRWLRSRPRSGCSWRCPGSGFGCALPPLGRAHRAVRLLRAGGGGDRAAVPGALADARSTACGGSTATACCRTGRPPPSPTAWRPRPATPFAVALWRAHLERALRAARALKAGTPVPQVAARDPYALRGAGARFSRSRRSSPPAAIATKRIAAAFDWHGVVSPANYRIDAWVTPPAYTGRPPLILPGLRPGEPSQARASGPVTVPAGSTLVVRATGQSGLDVAVNGGIAEAKRPTRQAAGAQGHRGAALHHHRRRHRHGARRRRGRGLDASTPSRIAPPTIALAKEPEPQLRGSLLLQLQARGRLRRGRRAGDVRAQARRTSRRPRPKQAAAPAVRRARISPWCCRRRAPAPAPARPPRI